MNLTSQIQKLREQIGEAQDNLSYIASAEGHSLEQQAVIDRISAHVEMASVLADQLARDNETTFSPERPGHVRRGMSAALVAMLGMGMQVRLLEDTSGEGADGNEHAYPVGTIGEVSKVERLPAPQGLAVTVIIGPQDGDEAIVNVFDEGDDWFPLELVDMGTSS